MLGAICEGEPPERQVPAPPGRLLHCALEAVAASSSPTRWLSGILPAVLPAADEAFLASAPSRFAEAIEVALPVEKVWPN